MTEAVTSEQAARKAVSRSGKKKREQADEPATPRALTAADILSAQDIKQEKLYIDEWPNEDGSPGYVFVRGLSSAAHERLVQDSMDIGPDGVKSFNMVGYQSRLTVLGAFNDDGQRIFSEEHIPLLMEKASGPIAKIATKVQELSGLGGEAVERMKRSLGLTPSDDSPSD